MNEGIYPRFDQSNPDLDLRVTISIFVDKLRARAVAINVTWIELYGASDRIVRIDGANSVLCSDLGGRRPEFERPRVGRKSKLDEQIINRPSGRTRDLEREAP